MQSKDNIRSILYSTYSLNINRLRTYLIANRDLIRSKISNYIRTNRDEKYIHSPLSEHKNYNFSTICKNHDLDLLTIAFNNLETIQTQYKYLSKNISEEFCYIVVDNSTKNEISLLIQNFCKQNKIIYIRLLGNPYNGIDPSRSHGIALNWSYFNVIMESPATYFGTLDHDIYPMRRTSIISHLHELSAWGHYQERDAGWYLWPGFSFFNKQLLHNHKLDFLPCPGLDTGGSNWQTVYKYLDKNGIKWPKHKYIRYRPGSVVQNCSVELIGDWIHLINASGWKDGQVKVNINEFLKKILQKAKQK
jgi:hypothetical protein